MNQWRARGSVPSEYWAYDPLDGWVYWMQSLDADTASDHILRLVNRINMPHMNWYYAIHIRMEAATRSEADFPFPDRLSPMWTDYTQYKTNEFQGTSTSVLLKATKSAIGSPLIAGQLTFAVFD